MAPRGKSKNRGGRNKEENVSPETVTIGSTKEPEQAFATNLSVTDWRDLLDEEDNELFIAEIVEEWVKNVLDVWYERYLDRATIPYVWEWYKSNVLELVRLDQLAPEPGEDPLTDPSWIPDLEPVPIPIDSWAPGAVPFITNKELKQQLEENTKVMTSPLQFETVKPLEPLVSDSTIRAQLSSALSLHTDALAHAEKDLVHCMDDYSSSDLSIVTATDSCDWWKWAQSRRLDKQALSQDISSTEEAVKRITEAAPEPLTGEQEQEDAYRQCIKWVELISSDEEEEEEKAPVETVNSFSYQSGARVDYEAIDDWTKAELGETSTETEEPQQPVLPPTPDTVLSECADCCKVDRGGSSTPGHGDSSTRIPELPAIKQLRALRLSRCSGLLVHSDSSESNNHLPSISTNTAGGDDAVAPAKPKHHSTAVGRSVDRGHYEQVDVDCNVMEVEKPGPKKTPFRSTGKASRKKAKQPPGR